MTILGCPACHQTFEHNADPKGPWPPECPLCHQHKEFIGWAGTPAWEADRQADFISDLVPPERAENS